MQIDYHKMGIFLLIMFFIFLIITLVHINPIIERQHPSYNKTQLEAHYGFYIVNVTCPNCGSDNITSYASHITEDNHNKRITSFFYCQNCSTIFSVRPSR